MTELDADLQALFRNHTQPLEAASFAARLDATIERAERNRRYRRWSVLVVSNLLVAILVVVNAPFLSQANIAFAEVISAPLFHIGNTTVNAYAAPYNTIGTALILSAIAVRMVARKLFT